MLATATRFKLDNWTSYPSFFVDTYNVAKQGKASDGIIRMTIQPLTLRTLTVWKTREHMLRFRNSGAHLYAMKVSHKYGAISSVSWESDTVPTWAESVQRLDAQP